jgi:sugar phosphate isomerase/epimerase
VKLGISSYTYTWAVGVPGHPPQRPLPAGALVERAAALGLQAVQIADNLPLHALAPAEIDALAEQATVEGVAIEAGTRGIERAHLRAYVELSARLGSPILRVVVDSADHRPAPDEIVATVRALVPALEGAGVTLAIENHDRLSSAALVEILERIDSEHVGICLDTANSFGALEGPEAVVEALGPWAVNLHLKDVAVARAGHGMGFTIEGRPAGEGQIDLPWVVERVAALAHRPVTAAILELWTPPEATLAATMHKERAWAERSVAYLRQFVPGEAGAVRGKG